LKTRDKGQAREKGQALVEFAITLPLFMLLILVTIELSLAFVSYYNETQMARDTSRWLSVHSRLTNDQEFAVEVNNRMLPQPSSVAPILTRTGTATIATQYQVGNMYVDFSACMPYLDVTNPAGTGVCTNLDRVAGGTLSVQISYQTLPLLFLPTTFRLGSLVVRLPSAMPAYKVWSMVE
jgi:Flp pilus assembly protein TadG